MREKVSRLENPLQFQQMKLVVSSIMEKTERDGKTNKLKETRTENKNRRKISSEREAGSLDDIIPLIQPPFLMRRLSRLLNLSNKGFLAQTV